MSKLTPRDLTIADDAIVLALAAVGDCLPPRLRDSLIAASDWCWMQRVDDCHSTHRMIRPEDARPHITNTGAERLAAVMARIRVAEKAELEADADLVAAEREYDVLFSQLFGASGFPSAAFDADYRKALARFDV